MWNDPALYTSVAALLGVFATALFPWLSRRLELRTTQPKVRTDALVAANAKLGELADRFEGLWRTDHATIRELERRVGLLEAEVLRLGGDPASINGDGG